MQWVVPRGTIPNRSNNGHRGYDGAVNIGRAFRPDFGVIPLPQLTGSSPREAPGPDSPACGIRVRPVTASLDPPGFEAVIKPGTGFSNDKTGHRIQ
jgi:hypothetical protein